MACFLRRSIDIFLLLHFVGNVDASGGQNDAPNNSARMIPRGSFFLRNPYFEGSCRVSNFHGVNPEAGRLRFDVTYKRLGQNIFKTIDFFHVAEFDADVEALFAELIFPPSFQYPPPVSDKSCRVDRYTDRL